MIKVEGLGKLYRLSHDAAPKDSFRDLITDVALAPFRRFRELSGEAANMEDFWALKDVTFNVDAGQVVGVLGRNGAGKSTLLKVMSRIVEPTEGTIKMYGRISSLLEVGTGFHNDLSGRENIFMNGSILGMKKREIEKKFDEIVAFAEVERFIDTPVKRYSSGMYVRLAFAVAAHLDPDILIVDEVLAVGDAEFQKKCLGKLRDVSQHSGRTVLFVSHNIAAIRSLCTHGIVMQKGRLAMSGTVEEACSSYLASSPHVATEQVHKFKRPADARLWMESVSILSNGEPAVSMQMGSSLSLAVDFASDDPVRQPKLGYVIQSTAGERVINCNNRFQPSGSYPAGTRSGRIVCELGQVPLMPGEYTISLWFGDPGADYHIELESIGFEVTERDLWGLGQIPPPASPLWWPTTYSFE
jgi:lipopolysaccharide transport system ATP-binding protein